MLYTLTMNPAIDMNVASDSLVSSQVNRTYNAFYSPNGKGINVSYVLQHYGLPSTIIGFFGGFSGNYIVHELEKDALSVHNIEIASESRINVFLTKGNEEYKLVNEGPIIPKNKQEEMLAILEKAKDLTFLCISGSLARGISEDIYDTILQVAARKNCSVILDISCHKLALLLSYHPFLIKPNDEEIAEIFGFTIKNEEDALVALEMLHQRGAQNILLTLGDKGSYFSNGREIYYAGVKKVTLYSSACAGDGALAGFLSIWLWDPAKIREALLRSAAIGANVAESNGLGKLEKVEQYSQEIQIRKVK